VASRVFTFLADVYLQNLRRDIRSYSVRYMYILVMTHG
jgi:hypothetical protein